MSLSVFIPSLSRSGTLCREEVSGGQNLVLCRLGHVSVLPWRIGRVHFRGLSRLLDGVSLRGFRARVRGEGRSWGGS